MNAAQAFLPQGRSSELSAGSKVLVLERGFCAGRILGRTLGIVALADMVLPAAFGANPAEEMFKTGTTTGEAIRTEIDVMQGQ